jgi:hypothetical protein
MKLENVVNLPRIPANTNVCSVGVFVTRPLANGYRVDSTKG